VRERTADLFLLLLTVGALSLSFACGSGAAAVPTGEHRCLDQLSFAEAGPFLLLTEEYSGECPKVYDLRTGDLLLDPVGDTAQAVWVDPPES